MHRENERHLVALGGTETPEEKGMKLAPREEEMEKLGVKKSLVQRIVAYCRKKSP